MIQNQKSITQNCHNHLTSHILIALMHGGRRMERNPGTPAITTVHSTSQAACWTLPGLAWNRKQPKEAGIWPLASLLPSKSHVSAPNWLNLIFILFLSYWEFENLKKKKKISAIQRYPSEESGNGFWASVNYIFKILHSLIFPPISLIHVLLCCQKGILLYFFTWMTNFQSTISWKSYSSSTDPQCYFHHKWSFCICVFFFWFLCSVLLVSFSVSVPTPHCID